MLALSVFLVACSSGEEAPVTDTPVTETPVTEEPKELSGPLTLSGATSVEKVGLGLIEEFMALNPGVVGTYESIGSSGGVKNAVDGVTQIGTSSRDLKDEEKAWGLEELTIAYDGIAVIVNPANPVEDLTVEQITKIYKGEITNWKEVGGNDEEIVVVSREDGSGTRGAFEELLDFEGQLTQNALIAEGNGNVQSTVAGNPKAIGYVSFSSLDNTIKPLKVEGVEPIAEDVINGTYKISRPFIFVYKEENLTEPAKAFLDFVMSEEGQNIIEENGAIRVK
jgi:phosphate transport system substrate-binding protein